MKTEKQYKVVSSKFNGCSESGLYTYEITFNKSLGHIGRLKGIEDGLNSYCKKELRTDVVDNIKRLWHSLIRLISN